MKRRNRGGAECRALALAIVLSANVLTAQPGTRLYVQPFDTKGGNSLREATVRLLKGQKNVTIVEREADADRVLSGTNQTYIKGYLSRNPRVRYRNSDSRPVYGGYVSVELKDRQDEVLWSYLITPGHFGSEDINKNLADQIVARLLEFLANPRKTP